ncbi:aspartyl/glutamyl-tRNA amidotransferase subunit B [candidate division WOR-1 bacterium RIFOXYB2_FULL_42_35]|uniref:Aspartyl/glutamyl-tRNA(Asn/Gln) amidotransferase subunit B n=1 Tax=candidate division WOR-1 bacterium RIFOXYC2_FULL_41_25 TaxID=1802586 RepID=A0A1F4TLF4_UNCSA|nr:MAG: aspartyl/glutamyl-tRNA amidotransferase subunit B [candidate division WOR-1 bacterium RIFOXYA2_FULL_41_14]OGC23597.1 MAG: aspartyl/glutamyl-tRNA amidotransferase subunit B [candidate division WOR-1 bacterium RIFOXYB2_FULL_42_35]OGC33561.1 MAG: aspartyl/glutamyl-tRNA amidotransferase subunit B [candidate division WOR-1 bacterium RIFOXYC2_FULL_41_25]OGC41878.1 MAG: aspartyl/glutamyl-tRNA amidotransferase subunit B [candidate division WOR-1 bacterium RIFOXYD2_FULL_41_8]
MKYETIIGLEIHAQLATESKMFCGCSTKFGAEPNSNICPVCTGQPGTLPVVNKKAFELAIKTAIALNCKIEPQSIFARKNYFYPDLPKDYQVSQYELPLATGGYINVEVDGEVKKIGITRVHLEEDAGKLVHQGAAQIMGADSSLVDYNRTGTPLMEIVSEPDIRSPKEAAAYMQTMANLLQYIAVSDAKLEEGSLRCDANISLRPIGQKEFGTKSELKNMNSFKAVEKALIYEVKRHNEVVSEGGKIVQDTRFYDEKTDTTKGMRTKEFAHDYRYFPEPDLVPVEPSQEWVEEIRQSLGELPANRKARFIKDFGLTTDDAGLLVSNKAVADFFEEALKLLNNPKAIANWINGELTAYLNEHNLTITQANISPAKLVELIQAIDQGTISGKIAKTVLVKVLETGKSVKEVVAESGLTQMSDEGELVKIIRDVIKNNPKQLEQYKGGKTTVLAFFVGQTMKATKGRANPGMVNKLLKQELG